MSRLVRLALVALAFAPAACGNKGTFVILDFPSGPEGKVASIHASLTLGTQSAEATFSPKAGGTFAFPTSGSLEIGKGAGALTVQASALDANGVALATATGMVTVVRDATLHLSLPFEVTAPTDGGMSGALAITPNGFDFGTVLVDSMSPPKRFTITNTGAATTGTLMVLLAGMDAADYELLTVAGMDCLGKALAKDGSCAVDVRFSPKSAGLVKNAMLRVLAPDGTPGGSAGAALLGSAGAKGDLMLSASSPSFPPTLVSASSPEITYTLTNTGSLATTAVTVSLSGTDAGSFHKTQDLCDGQTLSGKQSCTIKIQFMPTARGALSASLSAMATKGGTAVSSLTGTGQVPAVLTITGGATMGSPANLGTVDVNATGTMKHMFTVKNDGDFVTGVLSIDTVPAMSSDITPTAATTCNPGMTLAPGASCVGEIVLTPKAFGTKNAQIIVSATPGGSVSTYVTGVGHDQVTIVVANASGDGSTGVIGDTAMPHNFNCTGNPGTGMCTKTFDRTTMSISVAILATPDAATYSQFSSWSSPAGATCTSSSGSGQCSYTLDASVAGNTVGTPYTFTASYVKQTFKLDYTRRDHVFGGGALGNLTATNAGISCNGPCTSLPSSALSIVGGTMVTIKAQDDGAAGVQSLRRISGACTGRSATPSDASCSFIMDGNKNVDVTYTPHNYAFVTSAAYDGNLGGIGSNVPPAAATGAAAKCQALADAANLPGVFVAVLSDSTNDALVNIPVGANGWIRADGKPFAQNRPTLFGGSATDTYRVYYPLRVDETGVFRTPDNVRTFTNFNGTHKVGTDHCVNWTSNSNVLGSTPYGSSSAGSLGWIDSGGIGNNCSTPMRMYCMGVTQSVDVQPPGAPPSYKLVFLSTGLFTPGAGKTLADMNNLCKTEGTAQFGTTFKAITATSNSTMASQNINTTVPFVRPDKVVVADTPAQLFGAMPGPQAPISVYANGTYIQPAASSWAWTGANAPTVTPTALEACNDWGATTSTTGKAGYVYESSLALYALPGGNFNCGSAYHLYCVEQ